MSEPNTSADLIPPEEAEEDTTMVVEEVPTPAESLPEPAPAATEDKEELEPELKAVPDAVAVVQDEPATAANTTDEDETAVVVDPPVEFINEGLIRWEAARHGWLGARASDDSSSAKATAVPLDVDKIIDVLFHASSREARASNLSPEKFPRQVPLPQMVDILSDLWEAEGLDA